MTILLERPDPPLDHRVGRALTPLCTCAKVSQARAIAQAAARRSPKQPEDRASREHGKCQPRSAHVFEQTISPRADAHVGTRCEPPQGTGPVVRRLNWQSGWRRASPPIVVAACSGLAFAALGLWLLDPTTLLSIDAAVKLLQARSLIDSGFRTLSIPYPAINIDPQFAFFPLKPPSVFFVNGRWEGMFPTAVALLNALPMLGGTAGVVALSAGAGAVVLALLPNLEWVAPRWLPAFLLAWGTCFWFYCVLPWEHIPAVLLTTFAWLLISRAPSKWSMLGSALSTGLAGTLRHETFLLVPGLLLVLWVCHGKRRDCAWFAVVTLIPLLAVGALDALLFNRPPAAHLAHASDVFARWAGPSVQAVRRTALPIDVRYDTVAHMFLLGRRGLAYSGTLFCAFVALARYRSSPRAHYGVLAVTLLFAVQLGMDLVLLLSRPDLFMGLLRQSPFLVFAFLPMAGGRRASTAQREALLVAIPCLIAMVATINVNGFVSYGPRFLLPLLPMLVPAAVEVLWSYRPASGERFNPIWGGGVLLMVGAVILQVGVVIPAYVGFNARERVAVATIRSAPERVLVIDSKYTVSVVEPFYLDHDVLMAAGQQAAERLAATLEKSSVPSFLLVSREPEQRLSFPSYERTSVRKFGQTVLETWAARTPKLGAVCDPRHVVSGFDKSCPELVTRNGPQPESPGATPPRAGVPDPR